LVCPLASEWTYSRFLLEAEAPLVDAQGEGEIGEPGRREFCSVLRGRSERRGS